MRVEVRLAALALLALASAAFVAPCRAQEITLGEHFPLRGATETLTVTSADGRPVAGALVTVTYRPNSQTAKKRELAPTDASGQTQWSVEDAGVVLGLVLLLREPPHIPDHEPPST